MECCGCFRGYERVQILPTQPTPTPTLMSTATPHSNPHRSTFTPDSTLTPTLSVYRKTFFLFKCKIRRNMWATARGHDEQEYIFGIPFWPYNRKKIKPTKFANFLNFFVFYEFSGFPTKIVRLMSSQRNDSNGWFFYHKYNFSSSTR